MESFVLIVTKHQCYCVQIRRIADFAIASSKPLPCYVFQMQHLYMEGSSTPFICLFQGGEQAHAFAVQSMNWALDMLAIKIVTFSLRIELCWKVQYQDRFDVADIFIVCNFILHRPVDPFTSPARSKNFNMNIRYPTFLRALGVHRCSPSK